MKGIGIFGVILLLIVALVTAGCISGNYSTKSNETSVPNENYRSEYQTGELNFTVVPEKTKVEEGEKFKIYLTLTNVGNNTINVWRMREQTSYDINFWKYVDIPSLSIKCYDRVDYICPVIMRLPLRNEDLIELSPNESINDTRNSECWSLKKGEYTLNVVYHTFTGEEITKPYWIGEIQSNNVTIVVE